METFKIQKAPEGYNGTTITTSKATTKVNGDGTIEIKGLDAKVGEIIRIQNAEPMKTIDAVIYGQVLKSENSEVIIKVFD